MSKQPYLDIQITPPTKMTKPLLAWFAQYGRHKLPWQGNNVYHIWLSEVMLQQTQVNTVIAYFLNFIQHFPTIKDLANANSDSVMRQWAGLGYYARARNLHKTAQIIHNEYQGIFPQDFQQVIDLPGIGQSTAGAILSLGFNQHHAILDGNVKRVLARFHQIQTPTNQSNTLKQLWQLAQHHTPKNNTAQYTQAIMDLGATLCTRSNPNCPNCPLNKDCLAFRHNLQTQLPIKITKKVKPTKSVQLLAIICQNKILLQKRPQTGIWGGLWSLPECQTGQIQTTLEQLHLIQSNLNDPTIITPLTPFRHTFTHYHLNITPQLISAEKLNLLVVGCAWYDLESITVGIPKPVADIIKQIKN